MHKLIINLPNRQNRLINTINELRKVGLSDIVSIFEAKTPEYSKKNFFNILHKDALLNIKNPKNTNIIPNYKAVACAFSHLKCWEYIMDNDIKNCLIIEDDIEIIDKEIFLMDYNNMLEYINKSNINNKAIFISFNSEDFNCEYLNIQNINNNEFYSKNGYNGIKKLNRPIIGTHFYYINKKMARYLISSLKKIKYQIDIEIGLLSMIKENFDKTRIFGNIICKSIIQSKKYVSDIQNYLISVNEMNSVFLFKIDANLCKIIYDYIPKMYKTDRKLQKLNIQKKYRSINDYLDSSHYWYNYYINR
jgi:GR25 family glycosyltransferase involved in LPS biosynthesis